MTEQNPLKVFISYSHDSKEHKDRIRNLADTLRTKYGIDVMGDFYDEDAPHGKLLTDLMHSISNMDRVLIILTPQYRLKADEGKGGVGYESMLITGKIYNDLGSEKFIPTVIDNIEIEINNYFPQFMSPLRKGILRNNFDNDDDFMEAIARAITNKPKNPKPLLGNSGWVSSPELTIDLNTLNAEYLLKNENGIILFKNAINIAKRNDVLGFNKLARTVIDQSFSSLVFMRPENEKPTPQNELNPLMDKFVEVVRPVFIVSFAGFLSGNQNFMRQEGIMYDLLSITKWNNGTRATYTHIAQIPKMLVFIYHHLYGALNIKDLNFQEIIRILKTKLPNGHNTYDYLYKMHLLTGWVESLGKNCFDSFKFVLDAYPRWPWLNLFFDSEESFKNNLVTYQMTIHLLNFFDYLQRNNFDKEERFDIPPNFMIAKRLEIEFAANLIIKNSEFFKSYLKDLKISESTAIEQWPKWTKGVKDFRTIGHFYDYFPSNFLINLLM